MAASATRGINIRPMLQKDLAQADHIVRLAFGTFLGIPNPSRFMGDADYVRTRWKADPSAALAAEDDGGLIGSNFVSNWGSFGFFGPLTIRPDYWDRGAAQQLLAATMEKFREWGTRHLGLFTFTHSPKHLALYQKFGFWPKNLVAVMSKEVPGRGSESSQRNTAFTLYSKLSEPKRDEAIKGARKLTDSVFAGLDLRREVSAVISQHLGDVVLVDDGSKLVGFAVCHLGGGTEAGSGSCYAKFAAVAPGRHAARNFNSLLDAVEFFAGDANAKKISGGVNLARREAFSTMFGRGFRTEIQGLAMESGDDGAGYNRAGIFVIDDWR